MPLVICKPFTTDLRDRPNQPATPYSSALGTCEEPGGRRRRPVPFTVEKESCHGRTCVYSPDFPEAPGDEEDEDVKSRARSAPNRNAGSRTYLSERPSTCIRRDATRPASRLRRGKEVNFVSEYSHAASASLPPSPLRPSRPSTAVTVRPQTASTVNRQARGATCAQLPYTFDGRDYVFDRPTSSRPRTAADASRQGSARRNAWSTRSSWRGDVAVAAEPTGNVDNAEMAMLSDGVRPLMERGVFPAVGADYTMGVVRDEVIRSTSVRMRPFKEKFWGALYDIGRYEGLKAAMVNYGSGVRSRMSNNVEVPAIPPPTFIRVDSQVPTPAVTPIRAPSDVDEVDVKSEVSDNLTSRINLELTAQTPTTLKTAATPSTMKTEASSLTQEELNPNRASFAVSIGNTLMNSSGFEHFRDTSKVSFITIMLFVKRLEKIFQWAEVSTPKVVELLNTPWLERLSRENLLSCLVNRAEVEQAIRKSGKRFDTDYTTFDADKRVKETIMTWYLRNVHIHVIKMIRAGEMIMRKYNVKKHRRWCHRRYKQRLVGHLQNAVRLQNEMKETWATKYKGQKRVVIHLPSLSFSPAVKLQFDHADMIQSQQIGRLMDLHDPNVIVIFISYQLDEEYTEQIETMIENTFHTAKLVTDQRFWLLVPEAHPSFPPSASIASILLSSPQTLRRLKSLCGDLPAFILPGVLGEEEVILSSMLNIPLMGICETEQKILLSKSLQKDIISESECRAPPGKGNIKTEDDFLDTLESLMVANPECRRWMLKIDGVLNGFGIAYFDLRHFTKNIFNRAHKRALLLVNLTLHTKYVRPKAHFSFHRYLLKFLEHGGVIEAAPPVRTYDVVDTGDVMLDGASLNPHPNRSPSVFLYIEPDGNAVLLGTADQICTRPYEFWGTIVPQESCAAEELMAAAENVAAACYNRGVIGYVSIDFVVWDDFVHEKRVIWAIGIKPCYTEPMTHLQNYLLTTNSHPCHPPGRSPHATAPDVITANASAAPGEEPFQPGQILFDANLSKRLRLTYIPKIKWIDRAHVEMVSNSEGADTKIAWERRSGLYSSKIVHPGLRYASPYTLKGICHDSGITYNAKDIAKVLVPELIRFRARSSMMRKSRRVAGEPELFDVEWRYDPNALIIQVTHSAPEVHLHCGDGVSMSSPSSAPLSPMLSAATTPNFGSIPDIIISADIFTPGQEDIMVEEGRRVARSTLSVEVPKMSARSSLPGTVTWDGSYGSLSTVRSSLRTPTISARSSTTSPARTRLANPLEDLLRTVVFLPNFPALLGHEDDFNPAVFQVQVQQILARTLGGPPGPPGPSGHIVPQPPPVSVNLSPDHPFVSNRRRRSSVSRDRDTIKILSVPIPSVVQSRCDPNFADPELDPLPMVPQHVLNAHRVPKGLTVEEYIDLMEREAEMEDEKNRLARLREYEAAERKRMEEERLRREEEMMRKRAEEEAELKVWMEARRAALEGHSLLEQVAIESDLIRKKDEEERRAKIQRQLAEEERKMRDKTLKDDHKQHTSIREFMRRAEAKGGLYGRVSAAPAVGDRIASAKTFRPKMRVDRKVRAVSAAPGAGSVGTFNGRRRQSIKDMEDQMLPAEEAAAPVRIRRDSWAEHRDSLLKGNLAFRKMAEDMFAIKDFWQDVE
ncbi:hypothetical protein HK101_011695 [Irineochytrium annulatum]|nr:hypothetical protein HK101_011695 [Irineochytrium annulatum]